MYIIQGYSYVTFEWVMVAVTAILVAIRLYVRVWSYRGDLRPKSWRWAEVWVVLGWLLFLALSVCDSLVNHLGANNVNPGFVMTDDARIQMNKVFQAWTYFYKVSIYCMKAAMLCFYNELTPKSRYKTWLSIRIIGVFNFMGAMSQIIYTSVDCPVHELNTNPYACPGSEGYEVTTWTFHLVTDIMVFTFPFFIFRSATQNMTPRQKRGVYAMFGLGTLNIFSAIVLFTLRMMANTPTGDNIPSSITVEVLDLLYIIQSATAVAVPCCPQIRIFYKQIMRKIHQDTGMVGQTTGLAGEETMITGKSDPFWRRGGWMWAGITRSSGGLSSTRARSGVRSSFRGSKANRTVASSSMHGNPTENRSHVDMDADVEEQSVMTTSKANDEKV